MEAATPLRSPRVAVLGDVVVADALAVRDRVAVELVRERAEAGADPAEVLVDAIEIGARVLSREQAEVNADFVRTEFEKVSREVEGAFTEKARTVAEVLGKHVDDVFGPENGHLAKELERLFGAESAVAVQHQLRDVMAEQSARMREDLLKQFSSADAHNPLADFKAGTMAAMRRAAEQQDTNLKALNEQIAALRGEVAKLQAEREKAAGGRGRARPLDRQGPPVRGGGVRGDRRDRPRARRRRRRGRRPARQRRPQGRRARRRRRLRRARRARGSSSRPRTPTCRRTRRSPSSTPRWSSATPTTASGSCPSEDLLPGHGAQLREVNGDKLFVVFDPEDGSRLGARGRLRARPRAHADGRRPTARARRRRAAHRGRARARGDGRRAADQVASSRSATGGIDAARRILDEMADRVRGHLAQVDELVVAGTGDGRRRRAASSWTSSTAPRAQAWRSFIAAPVRRTAPV